MYNETVIFLSFFVCMVAFLFCFIYPFIVGRKYHEIRKNDTSDQAGSYAFKGAIIELLALGLAVASLFIMYSKGI